MIVRPTVLGAVLITIIVIVAVATIRIHIVANRIDRSNEYAEQLVEIGARIIAALPSKSAGRDQTVTPEPEPGPVEPQTAPIALPPNPPLVQDAPTPADEWRTRFSFKETA